MSITVTLNKPFMNETTWDLDGYVINLRGADLKTAATELGISFKSKTPVAEIREAIRAHYVAAHQDSQETPTDVMFGTLGTETITQEDRAMKNVEDMNRDELRAEAKERNIPGRGKMSAQDLRDAVAEARFNNGETVTDKDPEPVTIPEPAESVQETTVTRDPAAYRAHVKDQLIKAVEAGEVAMPYGYRGRGMGAKHYLSVSPRTINRQIRAHQRKALVNLPGYQAATLPNSERVQKYVRANGTKVLTPRQMKRTLKKANKNQDHTVTAGPLSSETHIGWDAPAARPGGLSFIGIIPSRQMGLFYRFAK